MNDKEKFEEVFNLGHLMANHYDVSIAQIMLNVGDEVIKIIDKLNAVGGILNK